MCSDSDSSIDKIDSSYSAIKKMAAPDSYPFQILTKTTQLLIFKSNFR